ncbi:MAG: hypothetical protein ACREQI_16725 [Candidatus Binataceae bacterium]
MLSKVTVSTLRTGTAALAAILSIAPTGHAQVPQGKNKCSAAEVHLLSLRSVPEVVFHLPRSTPPMMAVGTAIAPANLPGAPGKKVAFVVAVGPSVDSHFSSHIGASVSCTDAGILVTATLTLEYGTGLLDNISWRPEIELVAVPLRPDVTVAVKWQTQLAHDLTEESIEDFMKLRLMKFPIMVSKTIN